MSRVAVVGAGLAGTELAYQLSKNGVRVSLFEARLLDTYSDGVHKTSYCAELVCSNSFRSSQLHSAVGLLKEELRFLDSLLIRVADKMAVPAGSALAVSRDDFSLELTEIIKSTGNIDVVPKEVVDIRSLLVDHDYVVIASGPLSSKPLTEDIMTLIGGEEYLYFYDAIAPLVEASSIDMDICFKASRYIKDIEDEGDYINAPLDKNEYYRFVEELRLGQKIPVQHGDGEIFFRGCMPVEVMANDSPDNLLHGPMRGDGLIDPRTGKAPYSAIQLRKDNAGGSIYNMVGFQTRLTYSEQKRIFKTIPGFANVDFLRLGSMHKNIYINSPQLLNPDMSFKAEPRIFVAGQISGVEGYVESIAHALFVSKALLSKIRKQEFVPFPELTAIGALASYILKTSKKAFQPMKVNFGILTTLSDEDKKNFMSKGPKAYESRMAISKRSLDFFKKAI